MNYKIEVKYRTGNSYNSYDTNDFLEITFENLEVAKQNLLRIKEHYDMHNLLNSWNKKQSNQLIFKEHSKNDWFVSKMIPAIVTDITKNKYQVVNEASDKTEEIFDEYNAVTLLKLYTDSGNVFQLSVFWIGHFETLQSIEIVADNSDMKFEF